MTRLFRFFDFFLPAHLRNNPADLMRGYIFVGMILTNILISILVLIGLVFILELEENTPIGVGLDVMCLIAYPITLILLKKTGKFFLCATFLLTTLVAVIVTGIQITGGYMESPILQLLIQPPVTAFLLLGLRPGIFWSITTALIGVLCYTSAVLGVGYIQLLQSDALIHAMHLLLQMTLLVIVAGSLIVYEIINGQLTRMLNEERNRFEHKASHDDLTGIPNRFEFFRRLKMEIDQARERQHKVGVVYIDLDGFKPINDLLGHHMGDEALRTVAQRLQKILRLSDTTARLGGDEFSLILPGINIPDDIEVIMPKVLGVIREPINIDGVNVVVRASCGIAIFPSHSEDHNILCRYADTAMYIAKEKRDAYIVYEEGMMGQKSRLPANGNAS